MFIETHKLKYHILQEVQLSLRLSMEYGVSEDQREILLSWPRPFTWRDYPITGYLIECRDSQSELLHSHINGTEIVNAPVVWSCLKTSLTATLSSAL